MSSLPAPAPPRPLITHADSVRIAEAVRKRLEAAKMRDSITKARLAEETERKMMDSIIAANSGAAAGTAAAGAGPRRVAITEPADVRQWPEATLLGRAVADSLRRLLRGRAKQYRVIDQDSVRLQLARTRDPNEVAKDLNSELLVSIRLQALPHDSAMLFMQIWDMTAANAFRARTVANRPGPKSEALNNLDGLLLSVVTYLDEMSRAPRRPQAPTPPHVP